MWKPENNWWKPLDPIEKRWVTIAFIWCLFLTAMMPIWLVMGKQNVPAKTYKILPADYMKVVDKFVEQYTVGTDETTGIPIVEPPPGGNAFILARQFRWYPILKLKEGETYKIHISSIDVQHGFSLQPTNLNLQVLPGYGYVAEIVPTQKGDFTIVCNEFCGLAHHLMVGKIIVE